MEGIASSASTGSLKGLDSSSTPRHSPQRAKSPDSHTHTHTQTNSGPEQHLHSSSLHQHSHASSSSSASVQQHPGKMHRSYSVMGSLLGQGMAATAVRLDRRTRRPIIDPELAEAYEVIVYFGIIDILQQYNLEKKVEHMYKSIQFDGSSISAVDPALYARRFRDFAISTFPDPNAPPVNPSCSSVPSSPSYMSAASLSRKGGLLGSDDESGPVRERDRRGERNEGELSQRIMLVRRHSDDGLTKGAAATTGERDLQ